MALVGGLFLLALLLLEMGRCGYNRIESIQTIENAISTVRRDFPGVKPVSVKFARTYLDSVEGLVIIDARGEEEFAVSRLPGAVRLSSVGEVKTYLDSLDRPPATILIYGALGFRSAELAEKLREAGVAGLEHLEGGIFAWANQGNPIVTPEDRTATQVHPYNKLWGRLLNESLRFPLEE